MISSFPINLVVYSNDEIQQLGLGVYNNSYSSESDTYNDYVIEFYKNGVKLVSNPQFTIPVDNGTVYINQEGKFELEKSKRIVFTQSEDFNRFINDNGIEEVRIVYQPHVLTNRKTYKLYSETPGEYASIDPANQNAVIYSIVNTKQLADENGLVYEIDPETGEYDLTKPIMVDTDIDNDDYTLTTFTSSALKEHEVNIYWRDTGTNRPNDIQIQLRQNDEDYTLETFEGISENPQITTPTSNDTLYTYTVPEYDAAGQAYTYTSEISGTYSNYRYENGEEADSYLFYSQRTFECTLEWHSGHINYTPSQEEAAQYIINNFDFVTVFPISIM